MKHSMLFKVRVYTGFGTAGQGYLRRQRERPFLQDTYVTYVCTGVYTPESITRNMYVDTFYMGFE